MSYTLYPLRKQRLQRSELAVPGSNPTMIEKAAQSAADYVFLDCEDAVAPPDKEQARKNIIQALNDIDWKAAGKTVSVRINGLDTHYMYRDVVDIMEQAGSKLDTILIPKVGVPADVYTVECIVSQIEVAKGFTNKVAGKVFRIGHLGALDEVMIGGVLFAVEMALKDSGVNIKMGSGTGAAAEYFSKTATRSATSRETPKAKAA